MMSAGVFWLMAALLFAHFLGDFTPLATDRMQEAKANGGPLTLIAAHAAVHGALVVIAIVALARPGWALVASVAGLELASHFAIDAFRARLGRRAPVLNDPREAVFWYALGLDQLAHGLVLVGLAALAARAMT